MPTSTTERVPSAAVMSASGDAMGPAVEAVSGIELAHSPPRATFRATYTTPADTVARETCNGGANMLVLGLGIPDDFNG
jgi:hypothetical protein